MKAAIRSSALARIFLVAGFGVALSAMPANAQKAGGSITVGLELDIPGFDPLKVGVYDTSAETAAAAIFDTLVALDDNGKPVPKLALSWTHSDDYKTWTFKLRPGVKFHDGTPFNAQAVKENFDRQKDPANKCRCAFYIAYVNNVQAPDELTVVYNLNDPQVNQPALMTIQSSNNAVHSPTAWKTKGDDYNRNPVGTGPYILKSWTAGDRMVLEKNPDYWNKGHPYLDRIILKPLPDAQSRFASLQSGEADIVWDDEYDADNIMKAQKDPKMKVHTYAGSGAQVYAFNTKVAPFDDVRVRQALSMAIDRWGGSQALSKISVLKYVGGVMRPGYSMALPEAELVKLPGFSKDIDKSREEAKKLLQEAGVNGLKFKLLNRNVAEPYTPGAVYSIDQWRRIGVIAEHEQLETKLYQDRLAAGDFDVAIDFQGDYNDDPTAQFGKYLTKKASPSAYSGHADGKIDGMYEKQRRAINVAERTKIVREMDRYALTQAYNVPLMWWQRIIVNHKKIKGWYMTPSHYLWQDLSTVWLDQ